MNEWNFDPLQDNYVMQCNKTIYNKCGDRGQIYFSGAVCLIKMYYLPDNFICKSIDSSCVFCLSLSSSRLCLQWLQAKYIHTIFAIMCTLPFADQSDFCAPLNIQSDLILFKLPCCGRGKWGSDPFSGANEKLQSTHGCHFLSCLPQQIRDTVRVWMIRPVHFYVKKIKITQLGPKPIVIQLLSIRLSLQKQSVNDSKIKLARGTNRPSLKLIWGRITSLIKTCPPHVCWWYVV